MICRSLTPIFTQTGQYACKVRKDIQLCRFDTTPTVTRRTVAQYSCVDISRTESQKCTKYSTEYDQYLVTCVFLALNRHLNFQESG